MADFHRNLLKGGIYIYPSTQIKAPMVNYGSCMNVWRWHLLRNRQEELLQMGKNRIMDIVPEHIHQQVPYFVGSREMVDMAASFHS